MNKVRTTWLIVSFMLLSFLAATPAYSQSSFNDIGSHWAKSYIEELSETGVVQGYPDGSFKPNDPITRAEATKIAILGGELLPNPQDTEYPFTDLDSKAWYIEHIQTAYSRYLIKGYEKNDQVLFKPSQNITRAEFLAIIFRTFPHSLKDMDNKVENAPNFNQYLQDIPFEDVSDAAWFTPYIKAAYDNKIIQGKTPTIFSPNTPITRAEASKIIILMKQLFQYPYSITCDINYKQWINDYHNNFAILEIEADKEILNKNSKDLIISAFYKCYADNYDFLVITTTLKMKPNKNGYYFVGYGRVKNTVKGIGKSLIDNTYQYGIKNLKGSVGTIKLPYNYGLYEPFDVVLKELVLHELGHQWMFRFGYDNGLNVGNSHYSRFLSIQDPMGGNLWQEVSPGAFHGVPDSRIGVLNHQKFSPISLYLMGLMSKEEGETHGPYLFLDPIDPNEYPADDNLKANYLTLDEIVEGTERNPAYPNTQKDFSVAFILVTNDLNSVTVEQVNQLAELADSFPVFWDEATDYRSTMDTTILQK